MKIKNLKIKSVFLIGGSLGLFVFGFFIIWVSSLKLPDFKMFNERKVQSSTKIYDRTGQVLLYDVHENIRRTIIPYEEMGVNIKNATVAIEDSEFYKHKGIRLKAILRAVWSNFKGERIQGGSTITQQVIKGTLLTSEKTIARKIKEAILASKLEKNMTKEEILALYLNEAPYGGNVYGIKEASLMFLGKDPIDLTLAESAYLAAIPNGPTYYSPYGKNKDKLENRKNLVLKRMKDISFITEEEYQKALNEKVEFLPEKPTNILAPHFVFFIKSYLENKYGERVIEEGGLKVITTLDYELQQKAEQITKEKSLENQESWNGKNAAVVVIDPKTGQILSMVGSRDYFDKEIDGNYNVATALRQPGSSFKPIVYAAAFKKGYTANTVLFDVPTEFSSSCDTRGNPLGGRGKDSCYSPSNYDNGFRGPMTLRDALAQSINVVAVKLMYLVGVNDSIKMAQDLGITSLTDPNRYGLSLVIGGGETSLLEMTSAYGVFANEGVRNSYQSILSIEKNGQIIEEFKEKPEEVLDPNVTRILSDIMSDNKARIPTFGANSSLVVPGIQVAVKTGTTNNNRDAWTIGYTPSVVVGVWVGNNDNTPMKKGGVAMAGPIWNGIIVEALKKLPRGESFNDPDPIDPNIPPILRGFWQGGETFIIDKISGKLATEFTPTETREEKSITNVHTILHWIDKNNPLGDKPTDPTKDSLYYHFEKGIRDWWTVNKYKYPNVSELNVPKDYDSIHNENSKPIVENIGINEIYSENSILSFSINIKAKNQIKKIDIFVNDQYLSSLKNTPYAISIPIESIQNPLEVNSVKTIAYDIFGNVGQEISYFSVK